MLFYSCRLDLLGSEKDSYTTARALVIIFGSIQIKSYFKNRKWYFDERIFLKQFRCAFRLPWDIAMIFKHEIQHNGCPKIE